MTEISRDAFVNGLVSQHNVSRPDAERMADLKYGPRVGVTRAAVIDPVDTSTLRLIAEQHDPAVSVPIRARRCGDSLWMEIVGAPRTKKNSSETLGSSKSKPYKAYLRDVREAIGEVKSRLKLPLPERRPLGYNLCAHFYVDLRGEAADRPGLEQGLNDALQVAEVVPSDWVFRQADGTRVIAGERPRVALWITPIHVVSLDTPEIP
jgi:hypothetical protein